MTTLTTKTRSDHTYQTSCEPSYSMEPTLQVHDVVLVDTSAYKAQEPRDGDIVVRNGLPQYEPYEAGRPAYDMEIERYGIYVDGVPLDPQQANVPPRARWQAPDRIPEGCYVVLGDNRNDSEDSHVFGFAQSRGAFASGPRAGQAAGFTGRVDAVIAPPEHKQKFIP